jgi:hypothetical protein
MTIVAALPAAAGTMTTMTDARRGRAMRILTTDATTAPEMRKAGLPARGRGRARMTTTADTPGRPLATMTTDATPGRVMTIMTTDATPGPGMRKASIPVRGRDRATTTMTIAAAMAAGSVIARVTRRLLVAAGRSAKDLLAVATVMTTTDAPRGRAMTIMTTDATIARETRKAGLPVRDRDHTTMMIAAAMAAGSVIAPVTQRLLVAAGRSAKDLLAVATVTTTGVPRGRAMTIMTMPTGAAAAATAAGSVIPKVMQKLPVAGAVSPGF